MRFAASGLQGVAQGTTSTVIAILSLLAVAVLIYGFCRAVLNNRQAQIVVTDLTAPGGSAELAEAALLSPILRRCVERHIYDQRRQIDWAGEGILARASPELEPQVDKDSVEHVQRSASNSIETLSAALRAVAPDTADRFIGLFSSILPPPRGLSVAVVLLQRGTASAPRLGAAVEIVGLDMRPRASAAFWEEPATAAPPSAAQDGVTERILALLEPLARWIAVRLVVMLMVSAKRGTTSDTRQALRLLLAGGLFLQAMGDFPAYAVAFGEQACDELGQVQDRDLMPDVPLPLETLAGVRERMGWARHLSGDAPGALNDFRAAADLWEKSADLWEKAEKMVRDDTSGLNQERLTIARDRKLQAKLETDDPARQRAALAELAKLDTNPGILKNNDFFLFNRACLYAQASRVEPRGGYQRQALHWLGLAILRNPSLRNDATKDPALAPIHESITPFLEHLLSLTPPGNAQRDGEDAEAIVKRAIDQVAADAADSD